VGARLHRGSHYCDNVNKGQAQSIA
jgi:hypothetical protein